MAIVSLAIRYQHLEEYDMLIRFYYKLENALEDGSRFMLVIAGICCFGFIGGIGGRAWAGVTDFQSTPAAVLFYAGFGLVLTGCVIVIAGMLLLFILSPIVWHLEDRKTS